MKKIIASAAIVLASAVAAASEPSAPLTEAQRWLAVVDAGSYDESWAATDRSFRQKVTKEAWSKAAGLAREPLGALVSRKLLAEKRSTTLPGLPDGDYDMILFTSAFARKQAAVETIVLAHEPTGWKVDGYFVR